MVSNMFTYIYVNSKLYMFICNAQKRRMYFNIEQIKNNATHYIHIMKEYTRDITIIVSNTFMNINVKSRLYSLMKWAPFAGFAKKNNNDNNINNNNSNNKIMQSTMESITVLHLTFLHFSYQYLEQRQVIIIHIG